MKGAPLLVHDLCPRQQIFQLGDPSFVLALLHPSFVVGGALAQVAVGQGGAHILGDLAAPGSFELVEVLAELLEALLGHRDAVLGHAFCFLRLKPASRWLV